jgi:hypothetical protein
MQALDTSVEYLLSGPVAVVGLAVHQGLAVVGAAVVGFTVVGAAVVGLAVVGLAAVGVGVTFAVSGRIRVHRRKSSDQHSTSQCFNTKWHHSTQSADHLMLAKRARRENSYSMHMPCMLCVDES